MPQYDVAARLVINFISVSFKRPYGILALSRTEVCSCRHINHRLGNRQRNRFPVFFEAGEITGNRVLCILQRLIPCRSLRNASWQRRALRNEHTVFILLDQDTKLHAQMLRRGCRSVNSPYSYSFALTGCAWFSGGFGSFGLLPRKV